MCELKNIFRHSFTIQFLNSFSEPIGYKTILNILNMSVFILKTTWIHFSLNIRTKNCNTINSYNSIKATVHYKNINK